MIKEEFSSYLPLSNEEKRTLWSKAVFIFDTNVILDLYRYAPLTRNQVIAAISARLKGRVWLPHHVFLEFFRNRNASIETDKKRLKTIAK